MEDTLLADRTVDLAVAIQQIPAPTFGEARRAAFVRDHFLEEGLDRVELDPAGNVYARLPGKGQAPPVVVSAHLDTVFPAGIDLTIRREASRIYGPGLGDNSLGVAGLFGLLWSLRRGGSLAGDVWLVANVGEEGLGDLCGMRAVVDRFQNTPLAYLILEGLALGQVYHRALNVQRYRIRVETPGGHSWVDYGRPSAIHELAGLVQRLAAQPLPVRPRTTLNVGVISGGNSVNTIASSAELELDLRSENERTLSELAARVDGLVRSAARPDVRVSLEQIGHRPAGQISSSHRLVRLAQRCLEYEGLEANLSIGSTDANIPLNRGLPAVCVGLSTGGGAHTTGEYIHPAPVAQGLRCLTALILGAFAELAG